MKSSNRWIGHDKTISRSPDITPCDFFVWFFVREMVIANDANTKEESDDHLRKFIIICYVLFEPNWNLD